ncbi:MAG: hypothetical protein ACTTH3_06545 [Schwartzia sp. (in: firmicutes)]
MLEGIGRIHEYLRRSNLQKMATQKIATGATVDLNRSQGKSSFAMPATVSTTGTKQKTSVDQMRMAAIRQKMKNGDKLSGDDMKYLKQNDVALYRKARVIESAREELERDLKQARTKGEARLAMVRAAMKVSSEAAMADGGAGAGEVAPTGGVNAPTPAGVETAPAQAGEAVSSAPAAKESTAADAHSVAGNETAEQEVEEAIAAAMEAAEEVMDAMGQTQEANQDATRTLRQLLDGEAADGGDGSLPPTALLIIRALQKTWMAHIQSDAYQELPNDERDEALEKASGGRISKAMRRERHLAAAASYQQAAEIAIHMRAKTDA